MSPVPDFDEYNASLGTPEPDPEPVATQPVPEPEPRLQRIVMELCPEDRALLTDIATALRAAVVAGQKLAISPDGLARLVKLGNEQMVRR